MHKEESQTDLGKIRIHKNVIASIASLAAVEIEGVKRIGKDLKSGILELIGQKSATAIDVQIDKNEEIRVEIPLVIKYGSNIPEVANKAQENVRNALEKMTSLSIKYININVQGIERG
ncbi:MAG: Asp23/Gls24 family envelope stress response protein [Candidatus Omnitrophica bacterium]|nr:Asp23/Gls24 family envelope stress response protein [Candidatus Omnitrophota bacterium]MDD5591731.1 Asp23/Gls24 family envelope stress response protein [Candidatus Omnitrophota bacterium]